MKDYERKFNCLWKRQSGRCAVTGTLLVQGNKIDMHHILSDTKVNRKLYPAFIGSVWNLALIWHDVHMSKAMPKSCPEWRINQAEGLLQGRPDLAYIMDFDEAITLYCTGIG